MLIYINGVTYGKLKTPLKVNGNRKANLGFFFLGGGVPVAYNIKIINDIERKFGRVVETRQLPSLQ